MTKRALNEQIAVKKRNAYASVLVRMNCTGRSRADGGGGKPVLCWDDNEPFVLQMRHLGPLKKEAASIKSRDQTRLRSHPGLQISAAPRRKPSKPPGQLEATLPPSGWSSGQLGPRPAATATIANANLFIQKEEGRGCGRHGDQGAPTAHINASDTRVFVCVVRVEGGGGVR